MFVFDGVTRSVDFIESSAGGGRAPEEAATDVSFPDTAGRMTGSLTRSSLAASCAAAPDGHAASASPHSANPARTRVSMVLRHLTVACATCMAIPWFRSDQRDMCHAAHSVGVIE